MSNEAAVTAADIARLAGVGRAAVSNWRRRYEDFPAPVGGTPNSPLFTLAEVERWLRDQGKLQASSPWERLWQLVEAHRGDQEPADILAAIGRYLLRQATDQGSLQQGPGPGQAAGSSRHGDPGSVHGGSGQGVAGGQGSVRPGGDPGSLRPGVEQSVAGMAPGQGSGWPGSDPGSSRHGADAGQGSLRQGSDHEVLPAALVREVAAVAKEHGALATAEALWERFAQANARWMAVTPLEAARLIAQLADVRAGVVLDPACGAGSLLATVARQGAQCLGQEIDPGLAGLAEVRLALRGVQVELTAADSLLNDSFRGRQVDTVVCDPPVGERQWGHEELLHDERWEYGIPPRMESELAWVQHALAHVRPGGLVAILMPPSVASRRSGRRIRAELLRRGALRAVIALPGPVHLWLLRRPGPAAEHNLLVIEATASEWDQATDLVVGAWRTFDQAQVVDARPGVARSIPALELLGEEVDLTPARNLPVSAAPDTAEKLLAGHRELSSRLAALVPMLPTLDWTGQPQQRRVLTTVAELIKTGALHLKQSDAPAGESPGETVPVLDLSDVLADRPPTRRMSRQLAGDAVRVEPGDVVLPTAGHRLVARVINDAGAVLGRGLCLLRPNRDVLDPWFLAGFLTGSANSRQASTHLSAAARLDVRRCEIPRMPLAEQYRYAAVFSALGTFSTALAQAGAVANQVVQATVDGLVDGLVAPPRHPR